MIQEERGERKEGEQNTGRRNGGSTPGRGGGFFLQSFIFNGAGTTCLPSISCSCPGKVGRGEDGQKRKEKTNPNALPAKQQSSKC